ncbi:hypothetical protein BH23ACT10_BH23ACT10_20230 [soil metagenome]
MIALGLTVELCAAVLLVVGLLRTAAGTGLLWSSIAAVLAGLCIAAVGVRRARPPRNAWVPAPPDPPPAASR